MAQTVTKFHLKLIKMGAYMHKYIYINAFGKQNTSHKQLMAAVFPTLLPTWN